MTDYPTHLDGCIRDASALFPAGPIHHYGQLVCPCGGEQFDFSMSDKMSVFAVCQVCGKRITVYDLALYPAATKLSGPETFEPLQPELDQAGVFLMVEYSEPEPDIEFDPNDITWFQLFVKASSGEMVELVNDETA